MMLPLAHQKKKNLRPERPDALDALDVSDATCLTRTPLAMVPYAQTQFATAPCVRTQLARRLRSDAAATAYALRTRSVRAFAFWTQLSRQLRSDATATAYAFRTRSVKASAIWTQCVSSGRRMSWQITTGRRLSRHHTSRRSCQGDCIWTQLPRHMPSGRGVSGHLPSGRSACHPDEECHGEQRPDDACHSTTGPDAAVNATAFGRSCHSIENRSEALNHIRILGVSTYSSCIHYI